MADLSHWDFADDFSASEAASLILGVDPTISDQADRARPILEKLRLSYHEAWGYWHTRCDGHFEFNEGAVLPGSAVQSVSMDTLARKLTQHGIPEMPMEEFCRWVGWGTSEDGEFSGFASQRFSRAELARWLTNIGMQSAYPFVQVALNGTSQADRDTLGTKERNTLLTIIAALAKAAKIQIELPGKAALSIEGLTDELGAHVSKRAIEEHLKKIPDALATRMK